MYQLIAYIKFLFNATNQHGVHSPFIFEFVTKCLYDTKKHEAYAKINQYRSDLLRSSILLQVNDLGEGSRVLDSNQRQVSKMIKTSSSSKKGSKLLLRLSKYFGFQNVLELGTSLGMGTFALALAHPKTSVTTIEGCANTSGFAKLKLDHQATKNVEFLVGNFADVIPDLKEDHYDFIFFDGHHNKDATIQYFESLLPKAHNETLFVFDDIYWSKGMTEAWEYIKGHHSVSVTVDCFRLGFVFFRKEQANEHFKIRL